MKLSLVTNRRRGMILILALVVMAVLSIILSVMTLQMVSQRKRLHQRQRHLQAEWLARAGIELAAARLLENPAGFSEVNKTLAPDAKVGIVVAKADPDIYSVTVEAELGPKEEAAVARTLSVRFRRSDQDGVVRLLSLPLDKK